MIGKDRFSYDKVSSTVEDSAGAQREKLVDVVALYFILTFWATRYQGQILAIISYFDSSRFRIVSLLSMMYWALGVV